jgi:hypothetical protein
MRAPEPLVSNSILFQHAICDEAFAYVDDNMCAQRQIASILKQDLGGICYKFAEINKKMYGNDLEGVTPNMVLEFCRNNDYGCVLVHNESIITTLPGAPILAFTCHEDHCFFYKEVKGAHTLKVKPPENQSAPVLMVRDMEYERILYKDMVPYTEEAFMAALEKRATNEESIVFACDRLRVPAETLRNMNITFYPTMRNASQLKGILIKTKDGGDLRLKHVSADHMILAKVCEIFEQRHGVEFPYYGDE